MTEFVKQVDDSQDVETAAPNSDTVKVDTTDRSVFEIALEPQKKSNQETVFFNNILLNEGITKTNFYASWFFVLYMGLIGITFSTIEPQFINQQLGISEESIGKMTATLYLIDYVVRLFFALIYGPMIDHFGRKFVLTIGITLTSLGYFLIPILSHSLFPGYFIGKSLISCGVIALQMLPFSADYIDNSTKGIMTGINYGIAFVGGGVAAALLKILTTFNLSYKIIYWTLALAVFVIGFSIRLGIKGGNKYYRKPKGDKSDSEPELENNALKWKEVKKAFKEIPWVPVSIVFGILGNADFYIITTGLVIWIKSLLPANEDPTNPATNYQVIFFILSFALTAILSMKVDKIPHMKLIFPILIVATLGFILVPFVDSAYSPMLYIFFVIEGVSLPGVFVFSTYLSIRYNPPEIRGTLSGIGNGIGFLGAIIILAAGGFLHDSWRKDASFVLYGTLLALTIIFVFILCRRNRGRESKSYNLTKQDPTTPIPIKQEAI